MFGRSVAFGVVFAVGALGLSACTGAPDRTQEAARLQSEIAVMPGVRQFSANASNDITSGTRLGISADVRDADREQIAAVVARIEQLEGHDFDKYQQKADFYVADKATVVREGGLDAEQIADDSLRLRRFAISAAANIDSVEWTRSGKSSRLWIAKGQHPFDILAAADTAFADQAVQLQMITNADSVYQWWTVGLPLSADRRTAVEQLLSALPGQASSVTVQDRHISRLIVEIAPRDVPETALRAMIAAIAPTTAHPLLLMWRQGMSDNALRFAGSVDIGACDYTDEYGSDLRADLATPDSTALQDKLRAEYDTCRR
ncbi:hypothetical protein [Nocardia sp. NPDC004722]